MRLLYRILPALACLPLLAAQPSGRAKPAPAAATAVVPAAVPPAEAQPGASQAEPIPGIALAHRAEALKKAILSGHDILIEKAASDVDLLRRNYGTSDVISMVEALALWARKLAAEGQIAVGHRALDVAERWAPNNTSILSTRIALKRREGVRGYVNSLPEVIKLNNIRLQDQSHRWLWIVQHMAWLRMMVTLLLWGWALTMTLRYRRVLRHILEEPLERRGWSAPLRAAVTAIALTVPVVAGLDPGVSAMFWLWLLVPFLSIPELKISVVIIALQIVHPVLAGMEPLAAQQPAPSLLALQVQPQPRLQDLARVSRILPLGDREFLKGWEQLQLQDWAGAEATFKLLKDRHPNRAEVANNLGVAHYQLGGKEEASKLFDEAFAVAPQSVEILINQSIMAFERLDTVTGAGKHEEGRNADPVHYGQLMAVNRSKREQRAFALPLPDSPERVRALEEVYGEMRPAPKNPWLNLGNLFAFALPIVAVLAFHQRLKGSLNLAHPAQCVRCGEPFHTTDSPDPSVCPKCHHLFVMKDGLHQESRKKKLAEVAEYQREQRWMHRGMLVLVPGADQCFMGETRSGFTEFLFFCFSAGLVFATGRTVRYPGEILPDPASTWLPVGIFLLVLLLLRSWLKLLPRRS